MVTTIETHIHKHTQTPQTHRHNNRNGIITHRLLFLLLVCIEPCRCKESERKTIFGCDCEYVCVCLFLFDAGENLFLSSVHPSFVTRIVYMLCDRFCCCCFFLLFFLFFYIFAHLSVKTIELETNKAAAVQHRHNTFS